MTKTIHCPTVQDYRAVLSGNKIALLLTPGTLPSFAGQGISKPPAVTGAMIPTAGGGR